MNTKIKFLILGFIILTVTSAYLISQQQIEPPTAILKINGKEQISGIGSYCWEGTWKALCIDYAGLPTAQEPLIAGPPFTSHLTLPLQEPPYELRLDVIPVQDENELNLSAGGWRWWDIRDMQEKNFILPLESKQDIELSLEPGLYVLSVGAWWNEKGSARYGFLVDVHGNATYTVPETPESPVNQIDPSLAIMAVKIK